MKLWMSGEVWKSVGATHREARTTVECQANKILKNHSFPSNLSQWAVISIILPPDLVSRFPEIRRFHRKTGALEFRLSIPLDAFEKASPAGQVGHIIRMLERSIDQMPLLRISKKVCQQFRLVIEELKAVLGPQCEMPIDDDANVREVDPHLPR